jgi:diketogulonate reductase-like aldo/keto reductase
MEQTFKALNELVVNGQVNHIGVSNFNSNQMKRAQSLCDSPIITNQVPFGLSDREYRDNGVLRLCRQTGVLLTAYSPIKKADVTNPVIDGIAKNHEATSAQIALAWTIQQDGIITIPKSTDIRHLQENWQAAEITLSEEEMEILSGLR